MTARAWAFISGKPFLPADGDPFAAGLGGTEQAVIHLTTALAALGDTVTVHGAAAATRRLGGAAWHPGAALHLAHQGVTHVAINDATLLPAGSGNPVVWFHNEVAFWKELRRHRIPALLRQRPVAVFIGTEQARAASKLLPFRTRRIIPYGLADRILQAVTGNIPPPPHALFTSQAYRGLAEIIETWQRDIAPVIRGARLTAHIADADIPQYTALVKHPGITIAPRIGNDELLARLRQTRLLLAPGHGSETFCLAAAEAIALGVPVVTLGIGSLKERVRDGVDGFVCANFRDLAARACQVLQDDGLWRHLSANGIAARGEQGWSAVAQRWRAETAKH